MANILILLTTVVACTFSDAQESRPKIEAQLNADILFPGEIPKVRITITAPANKALSVIKEERVYRRRVLHFEMFASDGSRMPGEPPSYHATKADDDFFVLEEGKTKTMVFSVSQPTKPGKYTLRISFVADPEGKLQLEKELPLTCVEIPQQAIHSKSSLDVAAPGNGEVGREPLELMNVKTEKGYELIYRRIRPYGVDWCARLLDLDEKSKVVAVFKGNLDPNISRREIWLTFDKGSDLYFMRIEDVVGHVLEKTIIKPSDKK